MAPRKVNGRAPAGDFLSRAKAHFPQELLEIPEMGETVVVRALSAHEMRQLLESCLLPGKNVEDGDGAFDNDLLNERMVGACMLDTKGKRLVAKGCEGEIKEALPNVRYVQIVQACTRVNYFTSEGTDPGN